MQNVFLDQRTIRDIDSRVAKILRDIGDPEPPLRLEIVRDLLELDRAYYSSQNDGMLRETVHRMKLAGKQVLRRPSLLLHVVKKLDLKALWVPDRKRILIDSDLPSAKQRWGEAHEIGHSVIPWHEVIMHGDVQRTLSFACEERIEAEANYAAGRLLFLQEAFTERLLSEPVSFERVKALGRGFGNTMTSTLWRTVESLSPPCFGLIGRHPRHDSVAGEPDVRYFIRSRLFAEQFANVTGEAIYRHLQSFCFGSRGPIGSSEVLLNDVDGSGHVFFVESFYNHHDALTLGLYRGVKARTVSMPANVR